jgi:hypothetical protein
MKNIQIKSLQINRRNIEKKEKGKGKKRLMQKWRPKEIL